MLEGEEGGAADEGGLGAHKPLSSFAAAQRGDTYAHAEARQLPYQQQGQQQQQMEQHISSSSSQAQHAAVPAMFGEHQLQLQNGGKSTCDPAAGAVCWIKRGAAPVC